MAVLCFLVSPMAGACLAALRAAGGPVGPGAVERFLVLGLLSLAIAAVIAARLAIAPFAVPVFSAALVVAATVLGRPPVPEGVEAGHLAGPGGFFLLGLNTLYSCLLGVGLVWSSRAAFFRSLDPEKIPGWIIAGFKDLLGSDPYAAKRVFAGLCIVLFVPLALIFFGPREIRGAVFTTNNRWALKAVAMFGVALIASGLNLAD